MLSQTTQINSVFSGKVRVRACGILQKDGKVLLLRHEAIGKPGYLWSPPGGGVEFGDLAEETLIREFREETNLKIEIIEFLFVNEFIDEKHHAIELFYQVIDKSGNLQLGNDPELLREQQLLTEARYFTYDEIKKLPKEALHNAFCINNSPEKILKLRGLIRFNHQ